MFCNKCGKEIYDEAAVCPNCGAKTSQPDLGDGPIGGMGIVCFLFPVVGLILYLVWKDAKPRKSKGAGKCALWGLIIELIILIALPIVVGVQMFSNQAYYANAQGVASELVTYGSMVVQYWKTPVDKAGAGQDLNYLTPDLIAKFIGFSPSGSLETDTGKYQIQAVDGYIVTLIGTGYEKKGGKFPRVTTTVDVNNGDVQTTHDSEPSK